MSKRVLVIIDLQKDYFPGGRMELAGADEAGEIAQHLLERFRRTGEPVVHIQHEAVHEGAAFFLPGTEGMEIHDCVKPLPEEKVVVKHFANSFLRTDLETHLKDLGAESLVVAGMMTQNCVDSTVRAAKELGFEVTLVHDTCAAPDMEFDGEKVPAAEVQRAFLAALGFAFAEVVSTKNYLTDKAHS